MNDPRFARIKKDPRFKTLAKKDLKTKLNKRFNGLMKDPKFASKPKFDVYGNKNKMESGNEYKDHFEIESEQEEIEQNSEQEEFEQNSLEEQGIQSYNSDGTESEDIEIASGVDQWEEEEQALINAPEVSKATKRLALQNYDWTEIKAKELMVLFSSFLPQNGIIKSVEVFVSEYGKQKLQEEEEFGPRIIFKEEFVSKKENKDSVQQINDLIVRGNDENLDVDPNKLREYEKDRLKYYYAVITFDSAKTADLIFQQTNGNEFELSNLKIDLRFIPDDLELPQDNLQHKCDTLPSKLSSKSIVNRAHGHTDVKLTWEETKCRTNFWNKNPKALEEQDWDELIGEGSNDEDDDDKLKILAENAEESEEDWRDQYKKKSKSNLKITFNSGFNMAGNNEILDRYQSKPKKHFGPKQGKTDDFFVGFKEEEAPKPELTYKEKKLIRKQKLKEKRSQQAELELLVDDRNKNITPINNNDQRFSAIHTQSQFAIDPTHKSFKLEQEFQGKKKKLN